MTASNDPSSNGSSCTSPSTHVTSPAGYEAYNRNYVGTHFGGSLFAMTDPFWMLLTMRSLGRDYFVWDQAAEIRFLKPGRGTVRADFDLGEDVLEAMRAATDDGAKYLHWFDTDVVDDEGDVVAAVRKQVYVRRKPASRDRKPGS